MLQGELTSRERKVLMQLQKYNLVEKSTTPDGIVYCVIDRKGCESYGIDTELARKVLQKSYKNEGINVEIEIK